MDGAFKCLVSERGPGVVNDLIRQHREDCQLRLARIQNGVDPDYINGAKPKGKKKLKGY